MSESAKRSAATDGDSEPPTKRQKKTLTVIDDETALVTYNAHFLEHGVAVHYYKRLLDTVEWSQEDIIVYGKAFKPPRKIAAYGDTGLSYRYSGSEKKALPWTDKLLELKEIVEDATESKYNFVLCNYYANGKDYIGPHSDDERDLVAESSIASLSLGAARDFVLSPKKDTAGEKKTICLASGSLLVMGGNTQRFWKHSLPKRASVMNGRINLTFRNIAQ